MDKMTTQEMLEQYEVLGFGYGYCAVQRKIMELRRSNAAQPHANKSKYSRKIKHKGWND